jgi:predicted membrane GTPase involved in stress response
MVVGITERTRHCVMSVVKSPSNICVRRLAGDVRSLIPPIVMSLEQSLDFIETTELVGVTAKKHPFA